MLLVQFPEVECWEEALEAVGLEGYLGEDRHWVGRRKALVQDVRAEELVGLRVTHYSSVVAVEKDPLQRLGMRRQGSRLSRHHRSSQLVEVEGTCSLAEA